MAVTYGFFNSVNGDRKYNADQMSEYFRGIVSQGVFQNLDSGMAVSAGTGLSVSVAAGRAIIQDRWIQNSAALNLTISAASETYGRKDAVVIRLDKSSRAISITVKTGTPAASPVAPSMTRNATTYEMALAYVNVAAGASSVTVTDKRSDSSVCGWAAVAQATSGEVDQMLNAMKTGFDGVTYSSPAAMVQGEDQKLQDEITWINDRGNCNAQMFSVPRTVTSQYMNINSPVFKNNYGCKIKIEITDPSTSGVSGRLYWINKNGGPEYLTDSVEITDGLNADFIAVSDMQGIGVQFPTTPSGFTYTISATIIQFTPNRYDQNDKINKRIIGFSDMIGTVLTVNPGGFYRYDNGIVDLNGSYCYTDIFDCSKMDEFEIVNSDATLFDVVWFNNGVFVSASVTSNKRLSVPSGANQCGLSFSPYSDVIIIKRIDEPTSAKTIINCFGDSITQSVSATQASKRYPNQLQTMLGDAFLVNNFGVSGASSSNIIGRMCAIPVFISEDIVFPVGTNTVTVSDGTILRLAYPTYANSKPSNIINTQGYPDFNPCYIDGHKCEITIVSTTMQIKLLEESGGVTLHAGSSMMFHGGVSAKGAVNIVMMGTNGSYSGAADYVAQYQRIADYFGTDFLFLSQFDTHFEADGTYAVYKTAQLAFLDTMKANETAMKDAFGNRFINMREELINHGLQYAIDGGLLTSAALSSSNNIDAISNEIVPFGDNFSGGESDLHNGLLFNVHPNDAGCYAIAKIVYKRLVALGYKL